jgi:uncharacterized protein involved in tolerance to divalent cations
LNYKRKSKSPKFDEICLKYGNSNRLIKVKTNIHNYEDELVAREKKTAKALVSKTKVDKIDSIENHVDLHPYHHSKIPKVTVERSLRNIDNS